ncbi:MAG: MBL fold metallo-hydrolase [Actinomycetota bacterium]|nr:MBL fold metallo-hydrolase [Actinomycetota bacterium]
MSAARTADARRRGGPIDVVPGIWRVGGGSWGGTAAALSHEDDANVYLLALDGAVVLVDAGTRAGRPAVEANIRAAGFDAGDLTDLLLTHSHWDHTQAAAGWQAECSARTRLSAVGAGFLARGDYRLVGYQVHGPTYRFDPFRVDSPVADGEQFPLGRVAVAARHLPGHSPDSALFSFEHRGETIAVAGDVVFGPRAGGELVLGQLCSLWLSNLDQYVDSMQLLAGMTIDRILPGHGDAIHGRRQVREAVLGTLAVAESLAQDRRVRANLGV